MLTSSEELLDPTRITCLPLSPEEAYGIHDDAMAPRLSGRGSSDFDGGFISVVHVSPEDVHANYDGFRDGILGEEELIVAIDEGRLGEIIGDHGREETTRCLEEFYAQGPEEDDDSIDVDPDDHEEYSHPMELAPNKESMAPALVAEFWKTKKYYNERRPGKRPMQKPILRRHREQRHRQREKRLAMSIHLAEIRGHTIHLPN